MPWTVGIMLMLSSFFDVSSMESRLIGLKTVDEFMNICIDGINHKEVPGPEYDLMREYCTPWASKSCCTPEVARGIHFDRRWLNFDWDHCKTLSPRCREYFMMDLCFYECSPNVGPWLVEDIRKIRNERFKNVPLCQTVCDNWWEACKDDFTCLDNWAVGFNWSTGINTCPDGSVCQPFHKTYSRASDFCETLMGNSFQVVPDTEDCFFLWFDPKYGNPNEEVARKKASSILGVEYTVKGADSTRNGSENSRLLSWSLKLMMTMIIYLIC